MKLIKYFSLILAKMKVLLLIVFIVTVLLNFVNADFEAEGAVAGASIAFIALVYVLSPALIFICLCVCICRCCCGRGSQNVTILNQNP